MVLIADEYGERMKPPASLSVSRWERLRSIDPRIPDTLLGVGVFVITLLDALFARGATQPDPDVWAVTLIAAGTLPLIVHRRAPVAVLAVIGASGALSAGGDANLSVPLAIASYSIAARRDRHTVVTVALPIAVTASLLISVLGDRTDNWVEAVLALITIPGVPLLLGRVSYNRRRRIERDHVVAASEAVAVERARIARELHDVVAHNLSVMVMQAGAARAVLERDTEEAAKALARIEESGRTGLSEMRRLLGILKADGDETGLVPQPGLERLDELVEGVRGAGLPVEVLVQGPAGALPAGVDLTAYRLIQEALTNALKHAGRAHARVVISYEADAIAVEVADDGRGPAPDGGQQHGHGLLGMRERVALFGGTLETGGRPGGGFRVTARIPVPEGPGT